MSHPLYARWHTMMRRCYDKRFVKYRLYGERGITVCQEWHVFANYRDFWEGKIAPGLSVDRIDNAGPYSPENTRVADYSTQNKNRRPFGKFTASRIKAETGISRSSFYRLRAKYGDDTTKWPCLVKNRP